MKNATLRTGLVFGVIAYAVFPGYSMAAGHTVHCYYDDGNVSITQTNNAHDTRSVMQFCSDAGGHTITIAN